MDGIKSHTEKRETFNAPAPKDQDTHNDFREDFLNVISHELKTPLTNLKAYTQFLLKGISADEKTFGLATKIHESALRLQELTQNLLEAGQISNGKLEVTKSKLSLVDLMNSATEKVEQPGTKIIVDAVVDVEISADERKLERALVNVLSNAVKFSPASSEVHVFAGICDGAVRISVRDNGFGVNKRDQARIFEQFFRADTTSINQGLGLGLFIANAIIKAHGGYMHVESELGQGSTFSLIIPSGNSNSQLSEMMQLDHIRATRHRKI